MQLYAVEKIQAQRGVGTWEVVMILNSVVKAGLTGKVLSELRTRRRWAGSPARVEEPCRQEEQQVKTPWERSPLSTLEEEQASAAGGRVQGKEYQVRSQGVMEGGEIMQDHTGLFISGCATWRNTPSYLAGSQRMKPT